MPAPRGKNLLASRRRRQDDGDEEESVLGEFEDDSLSEGSAVSNGDDEAGIEGSDSSGDESQLEKASPKATKVMTEQTQPARDSELSVEPESKSNGAFKPSAETDATLREIEPTRQSDETDEIQLDDLNASTENGAAQAEAGVPKAPRHETAAQRSRREHQEYIRQRNANPAFVPTRGGFFLHDDRNSMSNGANPRLFARGRGRGYGPPAYAGRGTAFNEPTSKPWAHDLHEDHETVTKTEMPQTTPIQVVPESENEPSEKPATSKAPNRTFSFTTVLGNVNVQISLPGMGQKISVPNVVKKHHTLLPQHRPPLRRDKPVRVSVPQAAPRYVFPSTERSFIFIPRAMRPNQQPYARGRGRGSYQGSRRPSMYGSAYTPSIAMSRKSSIGASTLRDGIRSPVDSIVSRMGVPGAESTRPVVRMPSAVPTPSISRTGFPIMNGHMAMPIPPAHMQTPAMYGSHSMAIPMHQPRPQKAVSVADIESPASFQFKAPPQQQQQPFHQQVPPHMANSYTEEKTAQLPGQQSVPGMAGGPPLSQIPEGAVYAAGFQPYSAMGGPAYYGAPYNNGAVFYPQMAEANSYGVPMGGSALAPSFIPGSQSHPVGYMPLTGPADGGVPGSMMAHESNGMVYYYNPTLFAGDGQSGMQNFPVTPNGNMVAMANGMPTQAAPFYYSSVPSGMFYPAQSG